MSSLIFDALLFAIKAHGGQIRKYENEPYVMHCIRVARTVAKQGAPDYVVAAALLHDVLEDCPQVSHEDIKQFGSSVYNIVVELTDLPKSAGNRAFRKQQDTKRLHQASPHAQTIKCADCIDNLPSIVEHDPNFGPRFIREKLDLMPGLTKADAALYWKALGMVQQSAAELDIK